MNANGISRGPNEYQDVANVKAVDCTIPHLKGSVPCALFGVAVDCVGNLCCKNYKCLLKILEELSRSGPLSRMGGGTDNPVSS